MCDTPEVVLISTYQRNYIHVADRAAYMAWMNDNPDCRPERFFIDHPEFAVYFGREL